MSVPFIDLRRFESDFLDRWLDIVRRLSEQTHFVGSPEVGELEDRLADRLEVLHGVACANGTDALQLALRAAGVGPGDVVLLSDATFWATFEAVVNCGGRPVTVDIDPDDLQMSFEAFERAVLEHHPKAVVLVHLYGWGSARLADFRDYCHRHHLPLIEDGAQVFGSRYGDNSIFRGCHMATLSFYPAKVLGACGDAGMVLCSDAELATNLRQLTNHGRSSHYGHVEVGWNSRMGGFEAAYLLLSLDYIDERLRSRCWAAEEYRRRLEPLGVRCVGPPAGHTENGYLNVTLHDPEHRPVIAEALRQQGIGCGIVYPGTVSSQPGAAATLAGRVGGEEAEELSRRVLNLPLFAHITEEEIETVVTAVGDALERL